MAEALGIGQGQLLIRIHLRRAQRSADQATYTAIDKALADQGFINDLTTSTIEQAGMSVGALPTGWLQQLLNFLVANLPQILALIMALFGA
jgi:hypothetical protein